MPVPHAAGGRLWPLSPALGAQKAHSAASSLLQIRDFLRQLKGRVVREAIQMVQPGGPQGRRRGETQTPAPIEVRQDKAP